MSSATKDMNVVVSAGVTEYSRQLTDDQFPTTVFEVGLMNGMSLS
jgi:hypothetical protein